MILFEPISPKEEELLEIAKWRNESLIYLRSLKPTPIDFEHQWKWVYESIQKENKYYFIYSAIKDDFWENKNKFIGYCGFNNINKKSKYAEMSLLIGPEFRNKGYGKEAALKLLNIGFRVFNYNCIFIEVYKTTNVWEDFCRKLRFQQEGILRDRTLWQNKYYDSTIGSILQKEWGKS